MKFPVPAIKKLRTSDGTIVDIQKVLEMEYEDISEAASILPSYIGWFGYMKALAEERKINLRQRLKQAEAKAYFALKSGEFQANGFGERYTETALYHAVQLNPDVIQVSTEYAAAERDCERFQWCIDALKAKLDLLRSMESTRRMESVVK